MAQGEAFGAAAIPSGARGTSVVSRRRKARRPANACGPPGHQIDASLVVIAVDLLEEGLGVERARAAGNAGDDRKRNKGGQDGLHDHSPLTWLIGSVANDWPTNQK